MKKQFFTRRNDGFGDYYPQLETTASPVVFADFPGFTFFAHREDTFWSLSEETTGKAVIKFRRTRREAIEAGESLLTARLKFFQMMDAHKDKSLPELLAYLIEKETQND